MFLKTTSAGYRRDGTQYAHGPFLILWAGKPADGGHNGAGAEAPSMRAWALDNLQALRRAGQVRK